MTTNHVHYRAMRRQMMRVYIYLTVLALGLAVMSPAFAVDQTIKIVLPTKDTDGNLLVAGSLKHTRVEWGSCSGTQAAGWTFNTKAGEILVPDPQTQGVVTNLAIGNVYCFRAFSVTDTNEQSDSSNILRRWYGGPKPQPIIINF